VSLLRAKDNQHFFKKELCIESTPLFADAVRQVLQPNAPEQRLYMRSALLDELLDDIHMPLHMINGSSSHDLEQFSLAAAEIKQSLCGVWISTTGNITPLHFDLCHGLLCQVL
jgi:hypothetical protein